ncbi:DUF2946 family protein (plasmid) [Niveispirillum fermenti]
MLLVALVPRGYMPDGEALWRGRLTLALCATTAPQPDDDMAGGGSGRTADTHALPCPFAMMAGLSLPAALSALFVPLVWRVAVTPAPPGPVLRAVSAPAGLGARGPPAGR